jgi:hypothetical protein
MAIDQTLTNEAVDLMKRGASQTEVVIHLLSRGVARPEAESFAGNLARMKREAETAAPQGYGPPPQGYGPPPGASPWAAGFDASCGRCRAPMRRAESFFDPWGNQVCRGCNAYDQQAAAHQRVIERQRAERGGVYVEPSVWNVVRIIRLVFALFVLLMVVVGWLAGR